jgi:signal peptidase II
MRLRYVIGAALTGGIAVLDLFIKRVVTSSFYLGERIEVVPGFFALTYILNPGAAFGIMADWDSALRVPILLVASIAALGFLGYLYFNAMPGSAVASVALPLIAGGALANLYERLTAGAVVDYLDVYISRYHWPAFNLADASITTGVTLWFLGSFLDRPSDDQR